MNFNEAVEVLKQGKEVRREGWTPNDGYLVFLPGMKSIWKIQYEPSVNAGNYLFTVDDYSANDWLVAEYPLPVPAPVDHVPDAA